MALQVWLPLNGNLNNQGLADVTVTNNGATVDANGKIGSCYSFDGTNDYISGSYTTSVNQSFCCWVYFIALKTGHVFDARTPSGVGYQPIYINGNSIQIGGSGGGYATFGYTWEIGKWYHVCVTHDEAVGKLYINGVLINQSTTAKGKDMGEANFTLGCRCNSTNFENVKLNDVRIYDHALSPREVAEIAKGLVLHYPLNRGGAGRDNNIKASTIANRSCNNFVYNSTTNTWTMSAPVNSSSWGVGLYINDTSIKWKSGESWVVSMEVYVPKAMTWNHDINNKPDVSDTSPYTGNDYDDQRLYCSNGVMSSHSLQAGWNKIWFTQRAPAAYGLFNYSTNFGIVTTNETSAIDIQIRNIKGEIISAGLEVKPSSWLPNPADADYTALGFDDGIEYDVSGFERNGTKSNMAYSSDTARYHTSSVFNKQTSRVLIPNIWNTSVKNPEITFAFWMKRDDYDDLYPHYMYNDICSIYMYPNDQYAGNGYGLRISWKHDTASSSNGNTWATGRTIPADEWHHVCFTTKDGVMKLYIDGVMHSGINDRSSTGQYIGNYNNGFLGYRLNNGEVWSYGGELSDFRIYATALTADQVKQLYEAPISLANNGTLFANEFNET